MKFKIESTSSTYGAPKKSGPKIHAKYAGRAKPAIKIAADLSHVPRKPVRPAMLGEDALVTKGLEGKVSLIRLSARQTVLSLTYHPRVGRR
jgi:hypothetical protein